MGSAITGIGSFWSSPVARLIVLENLVIFTFSGRISLNDYNAKYLYTFGFLPSGYAPSGGAPLFGKITDGNYSYVGGVSGVVQTNGEIKFSCETHTGEYVTMFSAWYI